MRTRRSHNHSILFALLMLLSASYLHAAEHLPQTKPITQPDDIDTVLDTQYKQVIGFFRKRIDDAQTERDKKWQPDFSTKYKYKESIETHYPAIRQMMGLKRGGVQSVILKRDIEKDCKSYLMERISISLVSGLTARGLLLGPNTEGGHPLIIICPDVNDYPEKIADLDGAKNLPAWLSDLINRGVMVYIPQPIERLADHPYCKKTRGKDRRMILHRLGFIVGQPIASLDPLNTFTALDKLKERSDIDEDRVGIVGIDQGGTTGLFSAGGAEAAVIVNYFRTHNRCDEEPADQRLFGRLLDFGDAELAALSAPHPLTIIRTRDSTIPSKDVQHEFKRAQRFYKGLKKEKQLQFKDNVPAKDALSLAVAIIADQLKIPKAKVKKDLPAFRISDKKIKAIRDAHFEERLKYLRDLIEKSEAVREKKWNIVNSPASEFPAIKEKMLADYRKLVGTIKTEGTELNPRTKLVIETKTYKGYRVFLNVCAGVEVYGNLLVPKKFKGKMAAVITQHGFGGTPEMITGIGQTKKTVYHEYGRHLVEQGYVVFAPLLQHRKPSEKVNTQMILAEATGLARVAMPVAKTKRIVDFLQTLSFVDPERIGYYGLSYGGFSAIWIGPLEKRLKALVISGHFNDWRRKITADHLNTSYLRHPDEDMYNWNMLNRFTHVEMVSMIAPRPVCIEWGERDGITTPEWTNHAWKKLVKIRNHIGMQDKIELAHYDGVHEIHGVQSFDFLDRHLRPNRPVGRDGKELIKHVLNGNKNNTIKGRFWIPSNAKQFRGMAVKLSRVGNPEALTIQFGSQPGKSNWGEVKLKSKETTTGEPKWYELNVPSQAVKAGELIYFTITTQTQEDKKNHYIIYGPKPLGGKHWRNQFGLNYRVLVE